MLLSNVNAMKNDKRKRKNEKHLVWPIPMKIKTITKWNPSMDPKLSSFFILGFKWESILNLHLESS